MATLLPDFLDMTLLERGGLLMWPLLILSLIGFVVFIERTLYLHKGQIRAARFNDGIKNLVRNRRLLEALTVCEEEQAPVARVVRAGLLHHDQSEEKMRAALQAAALVELPVIERRVGTLAVIAVVAPLIGLLGTVVATMKAFVLAQTGQGYVSVTAFNGSVAEALVTTAAGLAIAVIAHLAHHFLHGRVRSVVHDLEWAANDILTFLLYDVPEDSAPQESEEAEEVEASQ